MYFKPFLPNLVLLSIPIDEPPRSLSKTLRSQGVFHYLHGATMRITTIARPLLDALAPGTGPTVLPSRLGLGRRSAPGIKPLQACFLRPSGALPQKECTNRVGPQSISLLLNLT